jgi:hypothetical protein
MKWIKRILMGELRVSSDYCYENPGHRGIFPNIPLLIICAVIPPPSMWWSGTPVGRERKEALWRYGTLSVASFSN